MKKILLLLFYFFGLLSAGFSQGVYLWGFGLKQINISCDTLVLEVNVGFPMGAPGSSCPSLYSHYYSIDGDTALLTVIYDTRGVWPAMGCGRRDTLTLTVPSGVTLVKGLAKIINNTNDTSAVQSTSLLKTCKPIAPYKPFPESGAWWHETYTDTYWNTSPPCVWTDDYFLFFNGDTVINGLNYHKLYKSGSTSGSLPPLCPTPTTYYNLLAGFLRQDSLQRKVYTNQNGIDLLLYDFYLGIGDSICWPVNCGPEWMRKISGIDSVLVGSEYHRRYLLGDGTNPDYALIEGVGSTFGLFQRLEPFLESGGRLICFNHNGKTYPADSNCLFTVNVPALNPVNNSFRIFPNPLTTISTVLLDKEFTNCSLVIYNVLGNRVMQMNVRNGAASLSREGLSEGVYFLEAITDTGQRAIGKFMVQ